MAQRAMRYGLALDKKYVEHTQGNSRYFLVNSRTAKWRLTPARLRAVRQTDKSERIHYTAIDRLNATSANCNFDPYPYDCPNLRHLMSTREAAFQALIDSD
jgi:hypothetical protein